MLNINHKTPSIEDRIDTLTKELSFLKTTCASTRKLLEEADKEMASIKLRINELNLMRGIRDGKYVVIDAETGDALPLTFHKKVD